MFTAEERITIDGRLAAFAGETMSEEEAEARGITANIAKRGQGGDAPKKTAKQVLVDEARELGIEIPKNATAEKIKELIELHSADASDGEDAGSGDGQGSDDGAKTAGE